MSTKVKPAKKIRRNKLDRDALRRWGFAATIEHANGERAGQHMPGVVFGNYDEAKSVGDRLKQIFLSGDSRYPTLAPDDVVSIDLIPYEKVSDDTKRQFEGLNDQAGLVTKALFLLAEKYRMTMGLVDKTEDQIVQEIINEARLKMFPRLAEAQAKMNAAGAVLDSGVVATEEPIPADEPKADRKRGLEGIQEAMEGIVEPGGPDPASILDLESKAPESSE